MTPPRDDRDPSGDHNRALRNAVSELEPRLANTLEAVYEAYQLCDELPQREHWRLAQVLRRHLRAVLRCLARANGCIHDADRCAELERAMLHCAHLDTLWTLCAGSLEWLPQRAGDKQRERWLGLREQLASETRGLARAMTLRVEGKGQRKVGLFLTHSLPDTYAGARPPVTPMEPIAPLVSRSVTSVDSSPSADSSSSANGLSSADASPSFQAADTMNTTPLSGPAKRRHLTARTTAPMRGNERQTELFDQTIESDTGAAISPEDAWTEGLGTWTDDLSVDELGTAPRLLPVGSTEGSF